jgi:hypothetical protein
MDGLYRRVRVARRLTLLSIAILPLMILALLDISQGEQNLALEWWIVGAGLLVFVASQVAVLRALSHASLRDMLRKAF